MTEFVRCADVEVAVHMLSVAVTVIVGADHGYSVQVVLPLA